MSEAAIVRGERSVIWVAQGVGMSTTPGSEPKTPAVAVVHVTDESRDDKVDQVAIQPAQGRQAPSWPDIYARLRYDVNDASALAALEAGVAPWARKHLRHPALRNHREDVVAETCSASVMGIRAAYGPETFVSFVYGHYLNARRRAHQSARLTLVPLEEADLPNLARDDPSPDELTLLERCLTALPARERRAVELRYYDGATTRQIAEALAVSEVNARRIVFNGLERLRRRAGSLWPLGRC